MAFTHSDEMTILMFPRDFGRYWDLMLKGEAEWKLPFALRRRVSVLMYYFRDEVVKLIEVLFLSLPQ